MERRNWDTASLILAIALAQYDQQEQANEFSTDDIELGKYLSYYNPLTQVHLAPQMIVHRITGPNILMIQT